MNPTISYWFKTAVALGFAAVLLWLAYQFFAIGLVYVSQTNVVAGVLAAAIGFAMLSSSVTLLRDWVLAVKSEGGGERR